MKNAVTFSMLVLFAFLTSCNSEITSNPKEKKLALGKSETIFGNNYLTPFTNNMRSNYESGQRDGVLSQNDHSKRNNWVIYDVKEMKNFFEFLEKNSQKEAKFYFTRFQFIEEVDEYLTAHNLPISKENRAALYHRTIMVYEIPNGMQFPVSEVPATGEIIPRISHGAVLGKLCPPPTGPCP